MGMIWNSGMGTPMPSVAPDPGRDYSPSSNTGYFDPTGREIVSDSQKWDRYIATIQQAMQQASGWERIKLQKQYEDAEKGRQNAITLEQMRNDASRYGVDAQRQTAIAQLQENQRQFDANHGLAVADTFAKWASTPDDLFQLQDVKANVAAASSGGYQTPLGAQGQPHAKTWGDFAALQGYNLPAVDANRSGGMATTGMQATGGGGNAGSGGGGTDPRVKAMRAVADALPPSQGVGHDAQDWAALNAIQSLYFGGQPGSVERLDPIQQRESMSGLRRLGWNPEQVVAQRTRSLPGQGVARAA